MENSAAEYFMGNFEKTSLSAKFFFIVVFFPVPKSQGEVIAHLNIIEHFGYFLML